MRHHPTRGARSGSGSRDELQPGDLLFYDTDPRRASPGHVTMYIGPGVHPDGEMIHAPRRGTDVSIVPLDHYPESIYMGRYAQEFDVGSFQDD